MVLLAPDAMGTWNDGLYDNDSALDRLGDLLAIDRDEPDDARLVASLGLLLWLNPASVPSTLEHLDERLAAIAAGPLPDDTRAALQRILDAPDDATEGRARTDAVRAALGGYSDGPRVDALLRFPGAEPAIAALAERAAAILDRALRADIDLYEVAGDLAALGPLIELRQAGLWDPPPARVAAWREGFAAIDRATTSERGFWWKYVRRVRSGFDLLLPAPPTPAPVVRKRPAPAPAPQPDRPRRFEHPQFGAATLIACVGVGASASLELRFDDGVVRKVLARFVRELPG